MVQQFTDTLTEIHEGDHIFTVSPFTHIIALHAGMVIEKSRTGKLLTVVDEEMNRSTRRISSVVFVCSEGEVNRLQNILTEYEIASLDLEAKYQADQAKLKSATLCSIGIDLIRK